MFTNIRNATLFTLSLFAALQAASLYAMGPEQKEFFGAISARNIDKVAAMLKENPGLIKARAAFEITPLHLAASGENVDLVKMLLACGANPFAKDINGETPLDAASAQFIYRGATNSVAIIDVLVAKMDKLKFRGCVDVVSQ